MLIYKEMEGAQMAVFVKDLKKEILEKAKLSDKIVIISGYTTPDIIEDIAKVNVEMIFYYGMYYTDGITPVLHNKLKKLDVAHSNLTIKIVKEHRVHTKCYLFYKNGNLVNALVGSANCSKNGLMGATNSEMLVELNKKELLQSSNYLIDLHSYFTAIDAAAVHCTDAAIVGRNKVTFKKIKGVQGEKVPYSGNPFVAIMPLYTLKKGKKVVHRAGGINWGLQSGHSKKGTGYAEAYIPVYGEHIDKYPIMFPFFPIQRKTTGGKITRKSDPVVVLWDDGVIMEMVFGGGGVERPTEGKRQQGDPYKEYPKNFTSGADGGGGELGEYLRKRMNVPRRKLIEISDLEKYKKDYIKLTYISPGYYEADFSGVPLP